MAAGKEARAENRPGTRTSPDLSHPGRDRRKPSKARRSEQRPCGSHLAAPRLALVGWPVPGFSSSSSSLSREGFRGAKSREKLCQGALPLLRPPDMSPERPRRPRAPTWRWPERGWPQPLPAVCSRSRHGRPARLLQPGRHERSPCGSSSRPRPEQPAPREEPATATAPQPAASRSGRSSLWMLGSCFQPKPPQPVVHLVLRSYCKCVVSSPMLVQF